MGKVAMVTGASRGIGRAISIDLARHGFDIAGTGRSVSASVEAWSGSLAATVADVEQEGRRGLGVPMDLTDLDTVRAGVEQVLKEFGRIDVLVTCATHIDFAPDGTYLNEFVDTSWESLEHHVTVNALSTLLLLRLVLPVMYEQGSGIVMNVTQNTEWLSMPDLPMPGQGMCGMAIPVTRGITDRLAPALKREVAPHGVTVLTFDPGLTLSIEESRYAATQKAGFSPEFTHSIVVPARAASHIATCHNPSAYNGEFVIAEDLVRRNGLMTEDEIFPDTAAGPQDVRTLPPLVGAAVDSAVRA